MRKWYESTTVQGIFGLVSSAAIAVIAAPEIDLPIPAQAVGALQMLAGTGIVAGTGVALKGRTVAKEPIAWTLPGGKTTPPGVEVISVLPPEMEAILELGINRLLLAAEQAAAQRIGLETASMSQPLSPGLDITDESEAIVRAAREQLLGSRQPAAPVPVPETVPDVPPELEAQLARIAGPPPAERKGKFNFVAQQDTRLKLSTETHPDNPIVLEGESVWAKEFRFDPDGKHLELQMAGSDTDDETRFIFNPHFRLRNANGHFEFMAEPPLVRPWIN